MRILKKATTEIVHSEAISEEDYEKLRVPDDQDLCRQIYLICTDNDRFPIVLDETLDTLKAVKQHLEEFHNEKTIYYKVSTFYNLSFAYKQHKSLHTISEDLEDMPIKQLIHELHLQDHIKSYNLKLYIVHLETQHTEPVIHADETHTVLVHYSTLAYPVKKTLIIRHNPPAMLIVNSSHFVEDHIKLRNLEYTIEENSSVRFMNSLDTHENITKSINFKIQFEGDPVRKNFLLTLAGMLRVFNTPVMESPKLESPKTHEEMKKFKVKKENRYGFNQKRLMWFDQNSLTLNISNDDLTALKAFKLTEIRGLIKTSKPQKIVIDFFDPNLKKIIIIFDSAKEMQEFLRISEEQTKLEVSTRFTTKEPLEAVSIVEENRKFRRFTWLDSKNTSAVASHSQSSEFAYNVILKGKISHEKIILTLDSQSKHLLIKDNKGQTMKVLTIHDSKIEDTFKNRYKVSLSTYNLRILLIFPSAYAKFHFTTNFNLIKHPSRVHPSANPSHEELTLFTMTWNLGSASEATNDTISGLLGDTKHYKVIALTFQQCKSGQIQNWIKLLTNFYRTSEHQLASCVTFHEMFLVLFLHTSCKYHTTNLSCLSKSFSKDPKKSRKGGLRIRFKIENSSFCLLACHLPSGHMKAKKRSGYLKQLLGVGAKFSDLDAYEFDYIVLMGDFGFKIDLDHEEVKQRLDDVDWLSNHDQFLKQIANEEQLSSFKEGKISFYPTYPAVQTSSEVPCWSDRIIYKDNHSMLLVNYESARNNYHSNHRAVLASFRCLIKRWFAPALLKPISEEPRFIFLKFKSLLVTLKHSIEPCRIWINFFNTYIDNYPKDLLGMFSGNEIEFAPEKGFKIMFYFVSSHFLADKKVILIVKTQTKEGRDITLAVGSLALQELVESTPFSDVDFTQNKKMKKYMPFESYLEKDSHKVGKISGLWCLRAKVTHN